MNCNKCGFIMSDKPNTWEREGTRTVMTWCCDKCSALHVYDRDPSLSEVFWKYIIAPAAIGTGLLMLLKGL